MKIEAENTCLDCTYARWDDDCDSEFGRGDCTICELMTIPEWVNMNESNSEIMKHRPYINCPSWEEGE